MAVELFLDEHGERADFIRDALHEEFFGREPENVDEYRVLIELTQKKIDELDDEIEQLEKELKFKRRRLKHYNENLEKLEEMEQDVAEQEADEKISRLNDAEPVNK